MADLTAFPKLEVLAEEPLLEHPTLELRPLAEPLLEIWVVRVGQIHSFRGYKAVERSSNIENTLLFVISFLSFHLFQIFRCLSPIIPFTRSYGTGLSMEILIESRR